MKRRILSLALTFAMMLTLFGGVVPEARAEEGEETFDRSEDLNDIDSLAYFDELEKNDALFFSTHDLVNGTISAVMTSNDFVSYLKYVVDRGDSRYGSGGQYSSGKYDGTYIYFDCWGLGESIIATKGKIVYNRSTSQNPYSLYDTSVIPSGNISGDAVKQLCQLSTNFSNLTPGEWLFKDDSSGHCYHIGYYVGNGKVIESTTDGSYNTQYSTIDSNGYCGLSGRSSSWKWTSHAKVPWINYNPSYLDKCTLYQAYDTIRVTNSSEAAYWSLPCSNSTDPSSVKLGTIPKGTTLTATALYKNDVTSSDHYWYKITYNGNTGYIYANNVEFVIVAENHVTKSGNRAYPTTHKRGDYFPVDWCITSDHLNLVKVIGRLINTTTGAEVYAPSVDVNGRSYQLGNEPVDNGLLFNLLPLGSFRCTVVASYRSYFINSSGALDSRTYAATPIDFTFTVVEGSSTPTTATLDLNGRVDGYDLGNLSDYATADVYVGGVLMENDTQDYCKTHPVGTSYKITDIKPKAGYSYNGMVGANYSGTIGSGNVDVRCDFKTINIANIPAETKRGSFNGHQYIYFDTSATQYESKAYCEALGGHLVSITSAEENAFVVDLANGKSIWLGGVRVGEGDNFQWVTGEAFSYKNWYGSEPNNSDCDEGGEKFVQMTTGGKWNDQPGRVKYGFICEIDSVPEYTVSYISANATIIGTAREGSYTIEASYSKPSGQYFSGWAYESGAEMFDLRPGDTIDLEGDLTLYAVYISHEDAVSGNPVLIYNIEDFDSTGYTVTTQPYVVSEEITETYWSDWSDWSATSVSASETVQVETRTAYGWYYFECPICHAHMHGSGECYTWCGGCGAKGISSITHVQYFPVNWNAAQDWHGTGAYYTTINGAIWFKWTDGGTQMQYRYKELLTRVIQESKTYTAYVITPNAVRYTVTYDANGGEGAPAAQTKTQGVALTLSTEQPTREGYTFLGWAEDASAETAQYQPGGTFTKDANTTLYAVWKTDEIKVTGVTLDQSSKTLIVGKTFTLKATVSPSDATNKSVTWKSSNTSVATVSSSGKVTGKAAGTAKITVTTADGGFTATCTVTVKEQYTITYDANGGEGAPAAQTKTQGQTLTLSTTVPTREGYTFLGWAESASAATAQYQPGGSFTKDANTTLYAVWQENEPVDLPKLVIADASVTAGDTLTITVSLSEPVTVKSIMLHQFVYDRTALTLTSARWEIGNALLSDWDPSDESGVIALADNTQISGTIFSLTFRVSDEAEGDYTVNLTPVLKIKDGNTEYPVRVAMKAGTIHVSQYLRGDVNGDGGVTSDDAIYLLRYTLSPEKYPINQSGDMNGDGGVTSDDAIYLLRYTLSPGRYPLH